MDNPELLEELHRQFWINCLQCKEAGEELTQVVKYIEIVILPDLKMQADIEEKMKREK